MISRSDRCGIFAFLNSVGPFYTPLWSGDAEGIESDSQYLDMMSVSVGTAGQYFGEFREFAAFMALLQGSILEISSPVP